MIRPGGLTRGFFILFAFTTAAACSEDNGPTGLPPDKFELSFVSGGGGSGLAGTVIDPPLVVELRNTEIDAPEEGQTVSWRVSSGSGVTTRTASATGEDGRASTRVVLGSTAGALTVEARVPGLDPVSFPSIEVLPQPTISSVTPNSADPGDVVEVRVANLPASLAATVLFDGVAGSVVERIDGSPTVLRTEVPAPVGVCSATVQSVDVRLRAGGVTTDPVSLTVSVPADPFQVGQVLVIEGTSDIQCAMLPSAGGTAKYLLVALSAEFEVNQTFLVTLGGQSVTMTPAGAAEAEPPSFHNLLRAFERDLALRGLPAAQPPADAFLFAEPSIGDTRSFWVLNDVSAPVDGELTEDEFDRVTATLEYIGANTLLYVDNATPSPGLQAADIQLLGDLYDRSLYHVDVDFFGEPTDVDGNDKVVVLLTPTVNGMTDPGAQSLVIGFVFALDLFPPNASNCPECEFSNGSEVFYGLVADPNGDFSDPRTRQRVLELLPGVMVHETQHLVSFRYKIFETTPPTLETLWLSEGMAHIAEELGGDAVDAMGDIELANDLYAQDFGRAARYLPDPEAASLTSTSGTGSLGERGAWWLFLRWIADQYGDFIFRDLTRARPNGVANVAQQTGESFFTLFADFSVAIWADDLTIDGLADRYQVPKWQLRSILQQDAPGGGSEYLLQPIQETFAGFRGGSISRFLTGSSPFFVELDAAGDLGALQLELNAGSQAGLAILRYE